MKNSIVLLCTMFFIIAPGMTRAVVIDFEEFSSPGSDFTSIGSEYEKDGFLFTASTMYAQPAYFSYIERDHSSFKGSTGLICNGVGNFTRTHFKTALM